MEMLDDLDELDEPKEESPSYDKDDVAKEALKRFKLACDAYGDQEKREIEDLRFQVPELQWDDDARAQRGGNMQGGVPVPARPCLSISKIEQPIKLVVNQMQAAHLGVTIHPLSTDATDETAAVLQDLYRSIERDGADRARSWAFDRAARVGRGCYRINTVYDEESDNPLDQKIVIQRLLYQDAAKFDPSATEADFSDAQWAFVTAWMPIEMFKRKYPKAIAANVDTFGAESMSEITPDWVKGDGEDKAVRVAEYFCKHYENESVGIGEQMRDREKVTLMWYLLAPGEGGLEVLDEREWNGPDIPLVPVIGTELQPFDEERRWFGMVRPARDAQKTFNYAASTVVEMVALEPKAPFVGAEGQFEGHESQWGQANTRNWPYLEYKPTTINGQLAPPPQRVQVDVGRLGPSMALLGQANDFIQSSTSTPAAALGDLSQDRSGKAITALQNQSVLSKSNYLETFAQVSMQYEARVVLGMIPKIYDRPGRIARVLDSQDQSRVVMLNALHNRRPVRVPPPMPIGMPPQNPNMPMPGGAPPSPGMGMTSPPQPPQGAQGVPQGVPPSVVKPRIYDLTKGRYGVSVTIGKSYPTMREEAAGEIGSILEKNPSLMSLIGPIYFKGRDFPGHDEIADILKKVRDQQYPSLAAPAGEETPDQLRAKIQGMQQQQQQLQQQLQQAQQANETEQARQQAVIQKAQIEAQSRAQVEDIDSKARMQAEQIAADVKLQIEQMKIEFQMALQRNEQQFEARQAELERMHKERLASEEDSQEYAHMIAGKRTEKSENEGIE